MSYEMFRNDVTFALQNILPTEQVSRVLSVLDSTATLYEISRKCTDLSVPSEDVPQIVKIYLAAKGIENKSKHTLVNMMSTLRRFFKYIKLPFDQITTNDIRAYLFQYKQEHGVSDSTLDKNRSMIHTFFKWCVDEEYLKRNPAAKIAIIKHQEAEIQPLESLELEIVRSVCKTEREKAIVDFLYCTGCRSSELCDVLLSDVDSKALTVHIRHGKGDKARMTYLNAEAAISLKKYLKTRDDDCPYLFISDRKPAHGIKRHMVQYILRHISARTEGIHLHPHKFRHTMATDAMSHGMPVEQVQKILGHANIATTMRYAKVNQDDVRNAHRKYLA